VVLNQEEFGKKIALLKVFHFLIGFFFTIKNLRCLSLKHYLKFFKMLKYLSAI